MCGALFWYMIKQREQHKQETDKMTEALNNNTAILTELVTLMKERDMA
jgi:preprotein translocase subunit YajC